MLYQFKLQCQNCKSYFWRKTKYKKQTTKWTNVFCSKECHLAYIKTVILYLKCDWCDKPLSKKETDLKRTKHNFCGHSCAASYHNTQRRRSRKSKCEDLLYRLLCNKFPDLKMIQSDKEMLGGMEIDIAVPELKLGIEWNGIVHYKPIYGDIRLTEIQQRDAEKAHLAQEKKIHLIVIPDLVSTETYVREAFLKIKNIIQNLIKPDLTESCPSPRQG